MKAFAGEYDREFTLARLADVRRLLADADRFGQGVDIPLRATNDGYDGWAPHYDDPANGFFALDESVLLPVIDQLPVGVAVDVACGTGRYADHLSARGHRVHGFDRSTRMLDLARAKVPRGRFEAADMTDLPMPDSAADLMLNTLAINHVEHLEPVFAEAARVLRPGGHLLVSDVRGYFVGSDLTPLLLEGLGGEVCCLRAWSHPTSRYLQAAIPAGFAVRDCRELIVDDLPQPPDEKAVSQEAEPSDAGPEEPTPPTPGKPPSIWELHPWAPAAAAAVHDRRPCLITWHLQLGG